ncbi:MAG: amidase [Burkholderiales bacterium]|jgi:amidase
MLSPDEYASYDALALAELVNRREVTPSELLASAWSQMEAINPTINAVCWPDREVGERAATKVDIQTPFAGVPFLLKDGGASAAGLRLTFGSRSAMSYFPDADGELTKRYRRAGLVIFGRTTAPEYGINVTCEGPLYAGPTKNPWDFRRSAGGSSSGAAAAVSAGIVPIAHGSDGGGSLRIPASCCGLFTLKVTRARMPHGPGSSESWSGMATSNVITRSVRDSAAALDATHGPDLGAPYVAPAPETTFMQAIATPPRILRIGLMTQAPSGATVHPDCIAAAEDAARLCESLGHIVEPVTSHEIDFARMAIVMRALVCANTANEMKAMSAMFGRPLCPAEFEVATWSAHDLGLGMSATDYLSALQSMHRIGRKIAALVGQFDLLLTPTLAEPPTTLGRFVMDRDYVTHRTNTLAYAPFTPLANVSGQPAMSVPLYWSSDGLPIGVQFIGPCGDEGMLLSLAAQLETARPWVARRPDLRDQLSANSALASNSP